MGLSELTDRQTHNSSTSATCAHVSANQGSDLPLYIYIVAQPLDPPCRAIGYSSIPIIAPVCFQVSQGIELYPLKFGLSQPRGGGGRGYCNSSCPQEGVAL